MKESEDHLEPVNGISEMLDWRVEYYSKVRKVLFDGLSDLPVIRFQVMPSFTPENVLDIEYDRENERYYLIYHICKERIWNNKKWEKIKVIKYKREIAKSLVELIESLFDAAISKTKFRENKISGYDGANYYFTYGLKTGTVWSPSKNSKMGKLVDIGFRLIQLTKGIDSIVEFDDKLKNKIEELKKEIKQ